MPVSIKTELYSWLAPWILPDVAYYQYRVYITHISDRSQEASLPLKVVIFLEKAVNFSKKCEINQQKHKIILFLCMFQ